MCAFCVCVSVFVCVWQGLKGTIIYYDGQMNDARMSLVVALTATQQGACIANRVKVIG